MLQILPYEGFPFDGSWNLREKMALNSRNVLFLCEQQGTFAQQLGRGNFIFAISFNGKSLQYFQYFGFFEF